MPRKRRPHGLGSVFQAKRLRTWSIAWYEHGRRRTKHGFGSRDLAQRVLAKIVQDVQLRGAGSAHPRSAPTLAEAAGPWLERREKTHRAAHDDANRWRRHVEPILGHLRPSEVDAARLRAFAEAKLAAGLAPASVRLCVMLLSALFCDLVERGLATSNPVRSLPKSTRRLYRPDHDPRTTRSSRRPRTFGASSSTWPSR